MKRKTKKMYEAYLNELIGENFGTKLRRTDPIQFNVGYEEWVRG